MTRIQAGRIITEKTRTLAALLLLFLFSPYSLSPLYISEAPRILQKYGSPGQEHVQAEIHILLWDLILSKLTADSSQESETPHVTFLIKKKRGILKSNHIPALPGTSAAWMKRQQIFQAAHSQDSSHHGPWEDFYPLFSGLSPPSC